MYELFTHILQLDLEWIFANYGTAIYYILFLVIFIETGLVIMPFLPGDSLLFTAGLFARAGYLDLAVILVSLYIAAVIGDSLNYYIGKNLGLKVIKMRFRGKILVKQEYLDKTHSFFEKYGPKTIIIARFVPIVRTFAPFVAGIAEMRYRVFILYNFVGGFIWIFGLTLAGYFLGHFEIIRNNIGKVALIIIFLSILPVIFEIFRNRSTKTKTS
jgi:membrane-associated protein